MKAKNENKLHELFNLCSELCYYGIADAQNFYTAYLKDFDVDNYHRVLFHNFNERHGCKYDPDRIEKAKTWRAFDLRMICNYAKEAYELNIQNAKEYVNIQACKTVEAEDEAVKALHIRRDNPVQYTGADKQGFSNSRVVGAYGSSMLTKELADSLYMAQNERTETHWKAFTELLENTPILWESPHKVRTIRLFNLTQILNFYPVKQRFRVLHKYLSATYGKRWRFDLWFDETFYKYLKHIEKALAHSNRQRALKALKRLMNDINHNL